MSKSIMISTPLLWSLSVQILAKSLHSSGKHHDLLEIRVSCNLTAYECISVYTLKLKSIYTSRCLNTTTPFCEMRGAQFLKFNDKYRGPIGVYGEVGVSCKRYDVYILKCLNT